MDVECDFARGVELMRMKEAAGDGGSSGRTFKVRSIALKPHDRHSEEKRNV